MKKSIFSLRVKLAFAALLIAGFVFVGCTHPANSDTKLPDNPGGEQQSNTSTPVALTASDALVGKWVDAYKSVYEITVSDFKNYGEGYSSYEGNEPKVLYTNDAKTEGFIYIKYTKAYESAYTEPTGEDKDTWIHVPASQNAEHPEWDSPEYWYRYSTTAPDVGKWYAISFKDLAASAVKVSGAYGTKSSTATLEEAVTEFTVENGYFAYYSDCTKQ
ncbi:MAG: hypothetical protein J5527_03865 [Treponema sp.]|nr:hypothetical protein [Treponema sp.]